MADILDVLRKEKKFVVSDIIGTNLGNYCSKLLREDDNNGDKGYIVRSLYFDTVDNLDYEQKLAGIELRKKIRLRIYSPRDEYAKLELKQKQTDNQRKRSLKITREHAMRMIQGDYSCLLEYDQKFALELYTLMTMQMYIPRCIIEYNRKAFILDENNTRLTFDSNIRATEANHNIFDEELCLYPVYPMEKTVLEVKYNNFLLSYIKDIINSVDKIETSVSKYCLARSLTLGGE